MAQDVTMYREPDLLAWLASVEAEMHSAGRHAQAQGVRSVIARIKINARRGRFAGAVKTSLVQAERDADLEQVARLQAELDVQALIGTVRQRLHDVLAELDGRAAA